MALVNGTNGNDNLQGTNASDTLQGAGGDDTLFGGFSGEDLLDGGPGNDTASYLVLTKINGGVNASLETNKATFFGSRGTFVSIENLIGSNNRDVLTGNSENNRIEGYFGSDDLLGRAGNDTLIGGSGFDTLKGELGDDRLLGGDDADLLEGGDGGDFLAGDKGNDTMLGGSGNDRFQWVEGDGSDLIGGGDGTDNLVFDGSLVQGDNLELTQSGSNIVLQRTNLVPITLTTTGIESFAGINGAGGDDVLNIRNLPAASGVQFIQFAGEDGNDRLNMTNVSANINAGGGHGNDILVSSNGNDTLLGGGGSDVLSGGNGNDRIQGAESGNLGLGEIDVLTGGAGQDTFVLNNFYDDANNIPDGDAINFSQGIDGTRDFARILDFKVGEDVIQLSGSSSGYQLKPITNSLQGGLATQDMGIFKNNKPGSIGPLESIAIVQDAPSGLNINDATQFKFI
jgi:Ca2+-binding RTX toxin-like protein